MASSGREDGAQLKRRTRIAATVAVLAPLGLLIALIVISALRGG